MNYVNCVLLVVVLVLLVVCCVKSKTKESFKYVQVSEFGKKHPKRQYCGTACDIVRCRQYTWLRQEKKNVMKCVNVSLGMEWTRCIQRMLTKWRSFRVIQGGPSALP
jgi:hypothetical protein